jgi:hypothetical protein
MTLPAALAELVLQHATGSRCAHYLRHAGGQIALGNGVAERDGIRLCVGVGEVDNK